MVVRRRSPGLTSLDLFEGVSLLLESLRIGRDPPVEGWARLSPAAEEPVADISVATLTSNGRSVEIIVVSPGHRLAAYRNKCANEAIVSAVAGAHGGSVTVRSVPGRTEFMVRLPIADG